MLLDRSLDNRRAVEDAEEDLLFFLLSLGDSLFLLGVGFDTLLVEEDLTWEGDGDLGVGGVPGCVLASAGLGPGCAGKGTDELANAP